MRYVKPHFYDTFACLADKCPDTCCAGWQIVIDEESLEKYSREESAFGNRLMNSIDWEEGIFHQYDRRCAFLNEQNFCDIYAEMGKDALCDTCRMYPRHVEEFDGLRELSLSLSCPEAARILLSERSPVRFLSWETEEEEDSFEEDEMDFLLFTHLEDARELLFRIIQERRLDIRKRMGIAERLAAEIQQCVDDCCDYQIDGILEEYEDGLKELLDQVQINMADDTDISEKNAREKKDREAYLLRCREYEVFSKMELLREEWGETMEDLWNTLYAGGEEEYIRICCEFDGTYGCDSEYKERWSQMGEQLMMFFIYTYFCGAVYDCAVLAKVRLATFSVRWVQELLRHRFVKTGGTVTMEDVIRLSWRYAREVEHSDVNLEILENWLTENPM